ncbi:MAG: MaoC family dehydratase N-terminal domain-containing protein [Deltaproteobacteria bacterium]|nr:MaoC family dehydratase N-terminal domain-containing protein [Deltaproteobacteria bacterium]
MSSNSKQGGDGQVSLDTSPVDKWIGIPLGGGQLKDPVAPNDIRRWSQGMQNGNPLYFDDEYASAPESRFGRFVAPQSFAVACDDSHGAGPAIQGNIPGTHMLFGGDEWWFFGPRIRPGQKISRERMLFDYKVSNTKFAGPTMFSRGDTTYINDSGEILCKQRSTSIRYLAEEARKLGLFSDDKDPEWSEDQLMEIEEQKFEYFKTIQELGHGRRLFVKVGDRLPQRLIGPHSVASFTTEWRAFQMTIWHAFREVPGPDSTLDAGWLPEMARDQEGAKIDPTLGDGLYYGPSRGHVQAKYAQLIGLPRGYGYGASMGAWIMDYISNWAGEWSDIVHSKMSYRSPAMTGDLTKLDGEVTDINYDDPSGQPVAQLHIVMSNHESAVLAEGDALVRLPTETLPEPEPR